ncbi:hypothetical protein QCE63_19735 [Caballeronia sp. LZ065]|nr:hypothetical protein [Caballeronia sp. LZ065]MDR5781635.1 hypothetical protein [Caballeronia sp. LZ065]
MNATVNLTNEQVINDLISPQDQAFTLPEGIVADGTDLVPTVQYLM